MRCQACQHDNRDAARFCEECAAPLERIVVQNWFEKIERLAPRTR